MVGSNPFGRPLLVLSFHNKPHYQSQSLPRTDHRSARTALRHPRPGRENSGALVLLRHGEHRVLEAESERLPLQLTEIFGEWPA